VTDQIINYAFGTQCGGEGSPQRRASLCLMLPQSLQESMSSLGFHIIYDFLNHQENVYCERVVYPHGKSLETGSPLKILMWWVFHSSMSRITLMFWKCSVKEN
jgi:hypothetical protein